ncbi:MAG: heme lyase NrfEFG subunit NrfE [Pelagibacterales bacterium]|nr:heme lyase NrfEFG subunit NrfE [Pelagibacterales bacterium]PPR15904.1 MAG: Cytochrome c-type biogenesis protein CcmF [Alphaproteobacteria bacterium MarineAlpha9_Bin3]|tara:strand:+ start:6437 stop:8407 length:1971 start_codon:yes stop_codon:yes gene_type:complete
MIIELGHYCLALVLTISLFQFLVPALGVRYNSIGLMSTSYITAYLSFILVCFSFASLTYAYVISDFSVSLVANNSHSLKPMIYKISGVWGNHEGSLLLWVLILTFYSAAVAFLGKRLPVKLISLVLSCQGLIAASFVSFILFTSNPFTRLFFPEIEGEGFNPILQDFGLAIHPPFLYLGYVGLSVTFSFSIAALLIGRVDTIWVKWVRPWTLIAWVFLTIGIALGSWWAYRELGWGGWWFWDPVENASFMPWLAATALLHSSIVAEKRDTLKAWTILLAIIAFSLSLLGTFIVRSGVLISVHAFASDPSRGLYILMLLIFFTGGALALFARKAASLKSGSLFQPVSREGALVINNIIFASSAATVLLGTLYPIFIDAINNSKVSVGPPYFEAVFIPLMVPAILLCAFSPMLSWKRAKLENILERVIAVFILAIMITAIFIFIYGGSISAFLGLFLGLWLILGTIYEFFIKVGIKLSFTKFLLRAFQLPRSAYGMSLAHLGVAIFVIGVTVSSAWRIDIEKPIQNGESVVINDIELIFLGIIDVNGPNWIAERGKFEVIRRGKNNEYLFPERRFYPASKVNTSEPAIMSNAFFDLYVVLGENLNNDESYSLRVYYSPFINWIWFGIMCMALGGILAVTDRKHRLGYSVKKNPKAIYK